MLKQSITLLKHAMMLKQCLTLLKHSKTVVNTVWLKSEAIQPFFCNHMKCLQNSPKCNSNLWHPCELISLSNALWAVSKRSRALWADLSLERALSCEQEFKSLVSWSLSLSNALWAVSKRSRALWADLSLSNAFWAVSKSSRAFWAISLSHVSFELRDWLTRSLLGSLRRNSVTTLSVTLHTLLK